MTSKLSNSEIIEIFIIGILIGFIIGGITALFIKDNQTRLHQMTHLEFRATPTIREEFK